MRRQIPPEKIEAWVKKHFKYKHRTTKEGCKELVLANPFSDNTKYKFNISLNKATCHDWRGDDWAGPVSSKTGKRNCSFINFVRLYLRCSFREALVAVLGHSGYVMASPPQQEAEIKEEATMALPVGSELLHNADDPLAVIVKKWLYSRGYNDNTIENDRLYYHGLTVVWPYFEFGELVYWQSRARASKIFNFPKLEVVDDTGKVTVTAGKSNFFYGFDDVDSAQYIIITEAIFDCRSIGAQALASGGIGFSDVQIQKLQLLGPRAGIILSPDNDNAGIRSILNNYRKLQKLAYPLFYSLPPAIKYMKEGKEHITKDWNELGQVVGFAEVRSLHDRLIKRLTDIELIRIRRLIK